MIKRWFDKKYINFLYFNEISDLPLAKTHRIFWKILQKVEKSWEKPTLPLNMFDACYNVKLEYQFNYIILIYFII